MKFPLCEKAGLTLFQIKTDHFPALIKAEDVEKMLADAKVLYGAVGASSHWSWFETPSQVGSDTHIARLVMVEPIKREPVKLEKIVWFPPDHKAFASNGEEYGSKLSGKRFKVTYEEIQE